MHNPDEPPPSVSVAQAEIRPIRAGAAAHDTVGSWRLCIPSWQNILAADFDVTAFGH